MTDFVNPAQMPGERWDKDIIVGEEHVMDHAQTNDLRSGHEEALQAASYDLSYPG